MALTKIQAVILAAGKSSRFKTGKTKLIEKICGQEMIMYPVALCHELKIPVTLVIGFQKELLKKTLKKEFPASSLISFVEQKEQLGTGHALETSREFWKQENILIMNGDTFCDIDFNKFWQFHVRKKSAASLIFSKVPNPSRFGTVKLDQNNKIVKFEEKKPGDRHGFVSAGVYLINKTLISKIPEGQKISLEKEMFPKWIGKEFYGFKVENEFIDIGTPESYKSAQEFFAKFKLK